MTDENGADRIIAVFLRLKDCMRKCRQKLSGGKNTFIVLGSLTEYEKRTGRHVTVSEISRISGLALPNVSRLLVPLEQEGLICREKNGRTVSVIITQKGNAALEERSAEMRRYITAALNALTDEEYAAFASASEKILFSLENNLENTTAGDSAC